MPEHELLKKVDQQLLKKVDQPSPRERLYRVEIDGLGISTKRFSKGDIVTLTPEQARVYTSVCRDAGQGPAFTQLDGLGVPLKQQETGYGVGEE